VRGGERLLQLPRTRGKIGAAVVADVIALGHKGGLGTPENTLIRLPRVGPARAEAEDRDAHVL